MMEALRLRGVLAMIEQAGSTAHGDQGDQGQHEKQRVALLSIVGAVLLTSLKLVVGLLTGSIGILAEAAHSTIDLVASVLTFFAVRAAGRPADAEHRYGHGKAENLAAFVQAMLLLLTVAWIVYEAGRRILAATVHVEVTYWSFAVMGISIVVDLWRSQALARAAHKHRSQALAADALNFRTDLLSSTVVLIGLLTVQIGSATGRTLGGWLPKADAIAALGVSAIVLTLVIRMLRETVDVLLDRAPAESASLLSGAVEGVPGVIETRRLRLREVGGSVFADVTIAAPRLATFEEAHAITEAVEDAVRDAIPQINADVVVHMEPAAAPTETPGDVVRVLARQRGMRTHNLRMRQAGDQLEADLHVEVSPALTLAEAHALTVELEQDVRRVNPEIGRITTHLEAPETTVEHGTEVTAQRAELVPIVRDIADGVAGASSCHEVRIFEVAGPDAGYEISLHCWFPGHLGVADVHAQCSTIERRLLDALPSVREVLVHAEPIEMLDSPGRASPTERTPDVERQVSIKGAVL